MHTHTHTYTHVKIVCVCMCVCIAPVAFLDQRSALVMPTTLLVYEALSYECMRP
jgi:hypothetical protein